MTDRLGLSWQSRPAGDAFNLQEITAAWDKLNQTRRDLPFLSASAVSAALTIFGSGRERMVIGKDDHGVVAIFLLTPVGLGRWQTFQPSQLPLGTWVAAPTIPLHELTGSLVSGLGFCLSLTLTQVDPDVAPRAGEDGCTELMDYIETGWIEVAGTFEDYWASRGKNLRQNMRKQRNKLAADGVRTSMRVLRKPEEMAGALSRYGVLESAGWKAGKGTAIHPDNAQGRFYQRLFEAAAAAHEAVVYEYLFDDRTVAINLCLLRRQTLIVLKTTYDESIKGLSPAFLLREEELQSFHRDSEIKRVEYFGRLMDWHTKLTENRRTIYHLTRYRWPWLKQLAQRRRSKPDLARLESTESVEAA